MGLDANAAAPSSAFKLLFPEIVDHLLADLRQHYDLPSEAIHYIRHNLTYNVPHGKLNRGLAVHECYLAFCAREHKPTAAQLRQAHVLGWCVELLQAFFLVADDIMDDSHTRRGRPCFFRLPNIAMNAINDAMILEMMIYRLLRSHFAHHAAYPHLVELFHSITYTTELGQLLDLTTSQPADHVLLHKFSEDALRRIYRYKTSHYTFYLPVALGMRLAGVCEAHKYDTAKDMCMHIGYYFQAQDDFLDAFGDPQVTGKIGTDIEDNTCTWLIVRALERCSADDRKLLERHYGKKHKESSDRVKQLYRKLQLPSLFAQFEQSSYERLSARIGAIDDMPTAAFELLLSKLYKRNR
ncbi:Farnesyl pyrophosphate synthase [Gracilariopsis chorda]|uniref:Farnesyl pyrophosphate synthase n=1 Tax=Gracilariopsis chorda TaxID=448386 RepID=A0A2V3J6J9_9FLOR|nr:Farnesyl pyrophosphate synthase [Gracilariopsis chorda]|eukprot:PXF50051.1 Farnesyl pyrophosphate synthase [Gracilariopsis chorda]